MLWICTAICLLSILPFWHVMRHERRTLWSGFTFLIMLGCIGCYGLLWFFLFTDLHLHPGLSRLVVFVGIVLAVLILLLPAIVLVMYFVEGIKVVRKEGFHPTNLLSLLFALAFFLCVFIWPWTGTVRGNSFLMALYILIEVSAFYLLFVMAMYVVSALLNLIHCKKGHHFDYVVVLGSAVLGSRVPPLLAGRIDKGLQLLEKNPEAKLLLSGGQGPGEDLPEGEAMAQYAIDHGADSQRIVIENRSADTQENLRYSRALMEGDSPKIAVVTTSYHVFRALILARREGIPCVGYGAKTKWYFTLNALIREFVGYLSVKWKLHAVILGSILALVFLCEFAVGA